MSNTTATIPPANTARDAGIVAAIVLTPVIIIWLIVWIFSGFTWKGFLLPPLYVASPILLIGWLLYLAGKISFERMIKPCWKYTRARPQKIKEYWFQRRELARDRNAKLELQKVVEKQKKVEEMRRAAGPVMTEMLDMGDLGPRSKSPLSNPPSTKEEVEVV
ncbi:uncharacterized protein PAC_11166 [Phialocephala subalpina]|uniref:Uncharacterized protein n=1 Tax=Phialocephala subalpina TaxID=576137 RepID=A0A1L7X8B9_9HELO|nr:uncharacterized protein PAC_11166 [Phialocephala subalpina]